MGRLRREAASPRGAQAEEGARLLPEVLLRGQGREQGDDRPEGDGRPRDVGRCDGDSEDGQAPQAQAPPGELRGDEHARADARPLVVRVVIVVIVIVIVVIVVIVIVVIVVVIIIVVVVIIGESRDRYFGLLDFSNQNPLVLRG